jgi:hypothetical protein
MRHLLNILGRIQSTSADSTEEKDKFSSALIELKERIEDSPLPEEIKAEIRDLALVSFSKESATAFIEHCRKIISLNYRLRRF